MATEKRLNILKQANKLFRQGKIDAAIKEYTKVLAIKPDDLEVRRIVGDLQLRQNAAPEAIKQFEWIADYYLKEGFFAKAIAMYKRISRIDPNYEKASFKLAELYTKQGLIIEAKQIFLDLAEEYKRQNNQKKSLDMYKKILEFDRNNIKMRLLLADNYFKENLKENAVNEYIITAEILLNKKDYSRAEDLLLNTLAKVKSLKIIQKLVQCYTNQGKDDKAIGLLKDLGLELFKNIDLLKTLGELYFKKNQINEAENVFAKIAEIDPGESEVIMRLGQVYLQREDYDRTYELFLPIIDKNIENNKFDEAASLLRFIIASKNTYLPALKKLASIFELSGKTSNLIALYESLLPIYEQRGMRQELVDILEKLIKLSDSPFTYEEQLARLMGEVDEKEIEEEEGDRESEFVDLTLSTVEDALAVNDFNKAVGTLNNTKVRYPRNVSLRVKLFQIYKMLGDIDLAVDEGKELLLLYQSLNLNEEYTDLLDILSTLKPEDEKLIEMSGEERTNIDIDFGKRELAEQMEEIGPVQLHEMGAPGDIEAEGDLLLLSDAENVTDSREKIDKGLSKSLSSLLSELDFYINDGYFGDAAELIEKLKQKYPGNKGLILRIEKFERARKKKTEEKDLEIISEEEAENLRVETPETGGSKVIQDYEDFQADQYIGGFEQPLKEPIDAGMADKEFPELDSFKLEMEPEAAADDKGDSTADIEMEKLKEEPVINEQTFQIEPSISEESHLVQEHEDSKIGIDVHMDKQGHIKTANEEYTDLDNMAFEIEMEEPENTDHIPIGEIDRETLVQSPSVGFKDVVNEERWSSSAEEAFDLDKILAEDSAPAEQESPFKDIDQSMIPFEEEEELLKGDIFLEDESYLEIEKKVNEEMYSITFWLKELEKQRTSTIEKNMMEIFDEFKKGIDEKIGKEDYETRYNLGIAYKEMGLIDEAIHEFLISSKHPEKFFDSAGLLGMCFREKGMLNEAADWYERALEAPDRSEEEYLAIKYELVITMKLKGDYQGARKVAEDIMDTDSDYRDISEFYKEIRAVFDQVR